MKGKLAIIYTIATHLVTGSARVHDPGKKDIDTCRVQTRLLLPLEL